MQSTALKNRQEQKYQPIILDSIRVDSVLDFDLYIQIGGQLVLYRSANLSFTDKTRQKLIENNVDRLYIAFESRKKYQLYIEKNLPRILDDLLPNSYGRCVRPRHIDKFDLDHRVGSQRNPFAVRKCTCDLR